MLPTTFRRDIDDCRTFRRYIGAGRGTTRILKARDARTERRNVRRALAKLTG